MGGVGDWGFVLSRVQLTDRQAEVYRYIVEGVSAGLPPKLREIGAVLGISKVTVRGHVDQLVMKGYVSRRAESMRGLSLVEPVDGRYASVKGDADDLADDLAEALREVLMLPVDQGMKCMVIRESSPVLARAHAALSAYDAGRAKPRAAGGVA